MYARAILNCAGFTPAVGVSPITKMINTAGTPNLPRNTRTPGCRSRFRRNRRSSARFAGSFSVGSTVSCHGSHCVENCHPASAAAFWIACTDVSVPSESLVWRGSGIVARMKLIFSASLIPKYPASIGAQTRGIFSRVGVGIIEGTVQNIRGPIQVDPFFAQMRHCDI